MSFVAAAIAGSAAVGAGASIYSGMQMADAAKDASAVQQDAYAQGTRTSLAAKRDALNYVDPFRQYGLNAGVSLQQALYSPEQRTAQVTAQRNQLQGEVDRLLAVRPMFDSYAVQGEMASERKANAYQADYNAWLNQLKEAQAKLGTFEKQAQSVTAQGQGPAIQESPWYQFQAQLLGRDQDRYFAARGLTGSGFEAEQRTRGLIELGAGETERQFARLKGLYDVGANASNVGAGVITDTAQQVSNNQIASGQAQAQGLVGVAGANANMVSGVANSITGAVGAGLNYSQFQNLIAANRPATRTAYDRYGGNLDAYG